MPSEKDGVGGTPGRGRLVAVLALLAFLYLYPRPHYEGFQEPNELARTYLVVAIGERGTLNVDAEVQRFGKHGDLARFGGHWYSNKAPGGALTALPAYLLVSRGAALAGYPLRMDDIVRVSAAFAAALPVLVLLWGMGRLWSRQIGPELGVALVFFLGAGTMLYPYATMFFSHNLSAAALGGTILLMQGGTRTARHFALAGFLAGWAGLCEYPAILAAGLLAVGAWALCGRRAAGFFLLGALPPAALLLGYNQICFGNAFSLSSFHEAAPQYAKLAAVGVAGVRFPHWDALAGLTLSPARGLFFLSPFLLLALPAWIFWIIWIIRKRRDEARWDPAGRTVALLSAAVAAGMLLFNASYVNWDAGAAAGPRYLGASLPAYGFAAGLLFARWQTSWGADSRRRGFATPALFVLGSLSVLNFSLITSTFPHFHFLHADWMYNPLASVSLPLLLQGLSGNNWGYTFGMPRLASLIPVLVATALAWGIAAPPLLQGTKRTVAVLAVASTLVLGAFWFSLGSEETPGRAAERDAVFRFMVVPRR